MSTATDTTLTDDERSICGARADVLIPNAVGMPSATQVDVHTVWIDRALEARPDLFEKFRYSLAYRSSDSPADALAGLHKESAELFDAFSVLIAGAYLMNPKVKELIGYPGQEDRPITSDGVDDYIHLLEVVVERGPVHRPTI